MKFFCLDNVGESHERMATNIIIDIANIGGLVEIAYVLCWGIYLFFGQPFKDIDLALSYQKLTQHVDPLTYSKSLAKKQKSMDFVFYLNWWFYNRFPQKICGEKESEEDDICQYFEELHEKVKYQLSLRHLSIMTSQMESIDE